MTDAPKPTLLDLKAQSVGVVLGREIQTGHMTPQLVKTLLARMDEAYIKLVELHHGEEDGTPGAKKVGQRENLK